MTLYIHIKNERKTESTKEPTTATLVLYYIQGATACQLQPQTCLGSVATAAVVLYASSANQRLRVMQNSASQANKVIILSKI